MRQLLRSWASPDRAKRVLRNQGGNVRGGFEEGEAHAVQPRLREAVAAAARGAARGVWTRQTAELQEENEAVKGKLEEASKRIQELSDTNRSLTDEVASLRKALGLGYGTSSLCCQGRACEQERGGCWFPQGQCLPAPGEHLQQAGPRG